MKCTPKSLCYPVYGNCLPSCQAEPQSPWASRYILEAICRLIQRSRLLVNMLFGRWVLVTVHGPKVVCGHGRYQFDDGILF